MTDAAKTTRLVAAAVLTAVFAAVAVILVQGEGSRTLTAHFVNAGGLVEGGRAQVAGRKVGDITSIRLAPEGGALVTISIADEAILPLRRGTRAAIRAVGQAGIANRFVDLTPGPDGARPLADGALLTLQQTSGIVNVDALLDSFGPSRRAAMRQLIARSADVYAGSGSDAINRMLGRLPPALADLQGVTGDLARDRVAVRDLVASAGRAADAIASRSPDLQAAVGSSAQALGAVAAEREALAGALGRAPRVLADARGTLARTGTAVTALRPALRAVIPAALPLREVLGRVAGVLPVAGGAVRELDAQLPGLRDALAGLRPLERPAVRALRSTGGAFAAARPILRGFRFYGVDFVIGALAGVGGVAVGPYDARGHYAKVNFVESPQTALAGAASELLSTQALVPGVLGVRTNLERRCPGGNVPPAPDGSSPWILERSLCAAAASTPASVNGP